MKPVGLAFLGWMLFTIGGTSPVLGQDAPFRFEDVTEKVVDKNPPGIGPVFDYAFLDLNGDNYLDIVLNNHHHSKPTPMFLGTRDHTFAFWKMMPQELSTHAGFWLGEVDLNGDGGTDLIYTGNEGGVVFSLTTGQSSASGPAYRRVHIKHSSRHVTFIDLDGDGALETLVRPGLIYKDLTAEPVKADVFHGVSTVSDFNNDGWPDLFSPGNRGRRKHWNGPRRLYRNNRGTLEEVGQESDLVAKYLGGIARTADFNNDGNMDLYLFNSTDSDGEKVDTKTRKGMFSMKLFLGDGKFGFTDVSDEAGLAASTQKEGYSQVYLVDLDNDSHVDIVNQGNYGTVTWRNNGDGTFSPVPRSVTPWATRNVHMRFDDFDMDGRLDVVTGGKGPGWKDREHSVTVFRNTTETKNHWLKIQLRQTDANTMGIGAVVTVYKAGTKDIVGKKLMLSDTGGYHPRLHFGLGSVEKVDVEVLFPTNKVRRTFGRISAHRYVVLRPDGAVSDVEFGARD